MGHASLSQAPGSQAPGSETPGAFLDRLDRISRRCLSACGAGHMVWRSWGAGPALVLLHGGSGSWRHWARNIDYFVRARRVIAPDLPGLGESDLPPEPDNPRAMARILAHGLAGLIGSSEQYDLVGFSFGGVMAGCLAAVQDTRLRSLTIVGSGGLGLARGPTALVKVRHLTGDERVAAHRTNLARLMIADPAKIDDLALTIQDRNTIQSRLKSPQISRGTWLAEALPAVRCPVAGIWGSLDAPSLPDIGARERARRALRPELRFRVIDGAGHWVAYEAAASFNAALADLLTEDVG
ncbi:MAG: alpha/beta fold hydrolase [Rhodospirillales bacterium]|nr:alpha/beta fold hydrolase [Rhodospirillales bacterium]